MRRKRQNERERKQKADELIMSDVCGITMNL